MNFEAVYYKIGNLNLNCEILFYWNVFNYLKVITVRPTAFEAAAADGGSGAEEAFAAPDLPKNSEFVGQELSKSDRPELTSAKVIN